MNELTKIAEESGLPTTQSELLLGIFQEFLGVTAKWEEKAKNIKVTDESQTDMMLLAREGRKIMQQLRLKLDRAHKEQKKIPLLYGRAVDGMKNVLRLPIITLEEYLQKQEDFVVNKAKAEALAKRIKADNLLAEQELAEQKALQEKVEAERVENIRLKEEADKKAAISQKKLDAVIAKQKLIDEDARKEREAHQREIEEKQHLAFEREEKMRIENEKELAAEREKRETEDKERAKMAKLRKEAGKARQEMLAEIDIYLDFDVCADMKDLDWMKYYSEKNDKHQAKQNKIFLEKQRAEREEKEKQEQLEAQPALKGVSVQCPACGEIFNPKFLNGKQIS